MPEFERNTSGFTADVEQYDKDTLVKIYREYVPQADIDREIRCTAAVQNKGLPVQGYRGSITYKGRRAILLEYIHGENAAKAMVSRDATEVARDFARVQFELHQCHEPGLEDSRERYDRLLRRSEPQLGSDLLNRCLKLLEKAPDGNSLCHNDYHQGNLIYSPKGLVCIDWSDASQGDPIADVARTVQMFVYGPMANSVVPILPKEHRVTFTPEMLAAMKQRTLLFIQEYEREYVRLLGVSFEEYERMAEIWKVIVPASRFWTEWDCNKPHILKMLYRYFLAHEV